MKVLIDARLYGLENAGLGRYALNLIEQIGKLDKANEYVLLLRKKYFDNLKLPKNFRKVLADFRHYTVKEQILLPKIIFGEKPDLVHFLHFNVPIGYRGKFVVTVHDLLMHKETGKEATTLPVHAYYIKRQAYKLVFRKAVKDAKRIIVPSHAVKDEVKNYYKGTEGKIVVTYEGSEDRFTKFKGEGKDVVKKYGLPKDYFIYVGNAYPHKNLRRAIEAAVISRNHLALVCSRSVFTKRLEETVEKSGAKDFVHLLGFVPDEDLIYLYRNSLGFIFPSMSEGFGLPGLEAMAAGTLVLASAIPVFKEVYKDKAIYFNQFNFSDIASKMDYVKALPPHRREELISESQKLVKTYSWEKMAEDTLRVYNELSL